MQRRRVVVRGRVQGVGFRWSTQREAERLGLTGWVANRSDGAVETVIEGEDRSVTAMLDWLRRGPRTARVTDLEVASESPEGGSGFRVRA